MNISSKYIISAGLAMGASMFLAMPAQAITMEQSQSLTQEFSTECSSNCSVKVTSSASQDQSLHLNTHDDRGRWADNHGRFKAVSVSADSAGNAVISWGIRGGTCTIRYTEANESHYKYSTSAACDEGQVTVGGLVPGRWYRFQVRQDHGGWSKTFKMRAW